MFSDYDSTGVCFGSMIRYNTCNQVLDMYRELTFTLKYWLYVLETENEDEEYLSLRFVFLE
ncbi:MAG TPA: hypothetical protein DCP51_09475 [Clostridiales bacterium]|nr:hypothetical protein [Clostridiales bacterium]